VIVERDWGAERTNATQARRVVIRDLYILCVGGGVNPKHRKEAEFKRSLEKQQEAHFGVVNTNGPTL